jgi:hypothetical protein
MDSNAQARLNRYIATALAALLLVVVAATAPTTLAQRKRQGRTNSPKAASVYSCPMHPSDEFKRPGRCPKCGMDLRLTRKAKNAAVAR